MGKSCDEPCVNGIQSPPESGVCVCHPCYAGKGCNSECSGGGRCVDDTHCECDSIHRGSLCEIPGCPGEKHDCSLHGSCNSADHVCMCMPGEYSHHGRLLLRKTLSHHCPKLMWYK